MRTFDGTAVATADVNASQQKGAEELVTTANKDSPSTANLPWSPIENINLEDLRLLYHHALQYRTLNTDPALISEVTAQKLLGPNVIDPHLFGKIYSAYKTPRQDAIEVRKLFVALLARCVAETDDKLRFAFHLFQAAPRRTPLAGAAPPIAEKLTQKQMTSLIDALRVLAGISDANLSDLQDPNPQSTKDGDASRAADASIVQAMFERMGKTVEIDVDSFLRFVHLDPQAIPTLNNVYPIMSPSPSPTQRLADEEWQIIQRLKSEWKVHADGADSCFILSAKWWRMWFNYCHEVEDGAILGAHLPPGPIDNNGIVQFTKLGDFHVPGFLPLRENLAENIDYVVLSPTMWRHLHRWYGGGPELMRDIRKRDPREQQLLKSPSQRSIFQPPSEKNSVGSSPIFAVDLYPMIVQIGLWRDGRAQVTSIHLFRSQVTASEVEAKIYEQLQLERGTDWRLWIAYKDNPRLPVEDLTRTLEELGLSSGWSIFVGPPDQRDRAISGRVSEWLGRQRTAIPRLWSGTFRSDPEVAAAKRRNLLVGLSNMGNTCFLSSAIQALAHTYPLTDYFVNDLYRPEFQPGNGNGKNSGKVTDAFVKLLKQMTKSTGSIQPSTFRTAILQQAPQFQGTEQQDAQEVLGVILECLHTDLNWITDKAPGKNPDYAGQPDSDLATTYWDNHLLCDASIIVSMFEGQFKSHTQCAHCHSEFVNFNPFLFLSLPVPENTQRTFTVVILRREQRGLPTLCKISVPRKAKLEQVLTALERLDNHGFLRRPCLLADVQGCYIFQFLSETASVATVREQDFLFAYEVPEEELRLVVKLVHRETVTAGDSSKFHLFANPLLLEFPRGCALTGEQIYQEACAQLSSIYTDLSKYFQTQDLTKLPFQLRLVTANGLNCGRCKDQKTLGEACTGCLVSPTALEVTLEDFDTIAISWDRATLTEQLRTALEQIAFHPSFHTIKDAETHSIDLEDIIREYEKPELMSPQDFFCPRCQEPRAGVKRETIWRFPPYLMIQLKRFGFTQNECTKNHRAVSFGKDHFDVRPFQTRNAEGKNHNLLNLIPYLRPDNSHPPLDPSVQYGNNAVEENQEPIPELEIHEERLDIPLAYELYSVICHLGSFYDGHYVTHAKTRDGDGGWYQFNDDQVTKMDYGTSEMLSSSSAYVLFYQQKNSPPLDKIRQQTKQHVDDLLVKKAKERSQMLQ